MRFLAHFCCLLPLTGLSVDNKLSRKDVRSIVDIRISEVQKRLRANGKDITINVSPEALDYLAAVGYHPSYGARPLARAIQTELLNPLSRYILDDSVRDGETAISKLLLHLSSKQNSHYLASSVTLDAKANRLVVIPNHEAAPGMDVDSDDDGYDDIEVEEMD